ncbi:MAG: phosphoribosyltransferase domain-containing protein, partial [Muribaculaceae bacterium]|nr:phosphoribosyltransferase domain-containing protein [Muribaculaceae bacterium]
GRRGGSSVCDAVCRHFPRDRYGKRYDVTRQRPSTTHTTGKVGNVLRRLPYFILDGMRMAEASLLVLRRRIMGAPEIPEVDIPDGLADILRQRSRPEILLIDDAIDSGDTLFAIVETLKNMNPDARIDIAVMTETTRHPRIRANHTLYRNRTLIRFPWSSDYKNL